MRRQRACRCASSASTRSSSRAVAPALLPRPRRGADRFAVFDPGAVFLNAAARSGASAATATTLRVQTGARPARPAHRRQRSPPAAPPLAVMDIAGAQVAFGSVGRAAAASTCAWRRAPTAHAVLRERCSCRPACAPPTPSEAGERVSQPVARLPRQPHRARAGGAVHRRVPGVLGARARRSRKRRPAARAARRARPDGARSGSRLVLAESALLGAGRQRARPRARHRARGDRAAAARRRPRRRLLRRRRAGAALRCRRRRWRTALLGVAAALVGGWLPARAAAAHRAGAGAEGPRHGDDGAARARRARRRAARARRGCSRCCRRCSSIPLAAYVSVALPAGRRHRLRAGGVGLALAGVAPSRASRSPLLAVERARRSARARRSRSPASSRASSLAVALTVMVASFRDVGDALARRRAARRPLRARRRRPGRRRRRDPAAAPAARRARDRRRRPRRGAARRARCSSIRARPAGGADRAADRRPGARAAARRRRSCRRRRAPIAVYVSEAMVDLYGAAPGTTLSLPLPDGRRADGLRRAASGATTCASTARSRSTRATASA